MKKICLTITVAAFLLICLNGLEAQTIQAKLTQVELINQSPIIGSWKYEYGKDTIGYTDITIYGTGIDANGKLVSKGKTVRETRINWAYDETLGKLIGLSQTKGGDDASLWAAQWISKNNYILVPYKDISNPEESSRKTEGTFKSHDLLEITYYENNKPVKTVNYTRVK
jgi:hypothetical protein